MGVLDFTVIFDVEQLYEFKRTHPDWVFLLGDKIKNPSRLVGAWKDITNQSMQDLEALVARRRAVRLRLGILVPAPD